MLHEGINWEFVIGTLLGTLGFAVGIYHLRELHGATRFAKSHADDLSKIAKQLTDVQGGLSTRYIREFPYFLSEIVTLLETAERRIIIFCDYPGYGYFSDPSTALEYEHVIDRKKATVNLSLTCLNSTARLRLQGEQFRKEDWPTWMNDPAQKKKISDFLAFHVVGTSIDGLSYERFIEIQEQLDVDLIMRVFGINRTSQVDGYFALHFWIADDTAIFSIPSVGGPVLEYGFKTSDRTLIEAFLRIPARYAKAIPPASAPHLSAKENVAGVFEPSTGAATASSKTTGDGMGTATQNDIREN